MTALPTTTPHSLDWTREATPPTEYCRFIRDYDFANTPLGAIGTWPQLLRQYVCQIMTHVHPRMVAWGPDLCLLHNQAAREMALRFGRPDCLGHRISASWPELMIAGLGTWQRDVMETGIAVHVPDVVLLLDDRPAKTTTPASAVFTPKIECHLSMCIVPILGGDGLVVGILHEFTDITQSVLAARRMPMIDTIDQNLYDDEDRIDIWNSVVTPLDALVEDVPFVIGYSIMPQFIGELPMQERLIFERGIGVNSSDPIVQAMTNDKRISDLLEGAWNIDIPKYTPGVRPRARDETEDRMIQRRAQNHQSEAQPVQMSDHFAVRELTHLDAASTLSTPEISDGRYVMQSPLSVPGRGFGAPVTHFIVIAIPRRMPPDPFGVLVIGLNPMRPYDTQYRSFLSLLKSIIINNITALLFPRVVRKFSEENQMLAKEKQQITAKLQQITAEKQEFEDLYEAVTEPLQMAPLGLAYWRRDEEATYVPMFTNRTWQKLLGINKGDTPTVNFERERDGIKLDRFRFRVHPEDESLLHQHWQALVKGENLGQLQVRTLRDKPGDETLREFQWVLLHYTHFYRRGSDSHWIAAWSLDITEEKINQSNSIQRVDDALEAQRVTEHFIDMVSHELRNPMSAMLQSAEMVSSSAKQVVAAMAERDPDALPALCESVVESAEVVTLCTQYQRRIVDDVLTLSKLDARLLVIVPERVHVQSLLDQLMHIYESELKAASIEAEIVVAKSYVDMQLNEVMLDPGRLLQVLMNIFTNAQKFTRSSPQRKITFHLGGSFTRPEKGPDGSHYLPFRNEGVLKNDEQRAEKNVRENTQATVFLCFSIIDTGRGMSSANLKQLFKKFSQASPKTYGKYGGSGLGLFITRDLVELQGGQIGVSSKEGKGATFFFYIKAERIPDAKRPKLRRKSSWAAMLSEIKTQKGDMDRETTELRARRQTPSPAASERDDQSPVVTPTYSFESPSSPGFPKGKHWPVDILLVEDNLINQRILAQQLRKEGYAVATADNGLEGVEYVKQSTFATNPQPRSTTSTECSPGSTSQPATPAFVAPKLLTIILMDIEMPVMDGLTATRTIRDLEKQGLVNGHIPILAVTANARPEQKRSAKDAGMDDILTKPFRISELLTKMNDLIESSGGRSASGGMVPM